TEKTETITQVDLTKSVCYFLGMNPSSGTMDDQFSRVSLVNSTTVKAERDAHNSKAHPHTMLCVLEFSSGIASVQQGVSDLAGNEGVKDVTIDEVDITKAILFYGGWSFDTGYDLMEADHYWPHIYLRNSTTVRAIRSADAPSQHTYVGFTVLEFS
ncbi:unnamed protein product, partial [marine sediment metagenome]